MKEAYQLAHKKKRKKKEEYSVKKGKDMMLTNLLK